MLSQGRDPAIRPLFVRDPALLALPHLALGSFPTPLEESEALSRRLGTVVLVKRDERAGGTKVRKLEFLLARAVDRGARRVFTLGAEGSNHVVATALLARRLGLGCQALLVPRPATAERDRGIQAARDAGAILRHTASRPAFIARAAQAYLSCLKEGTLWIPPGGTSALGMLGMVNAGLELAGDLAQRGMEPPRTIFAAAGTLGIASGLAAGLIAAGLPTRVMAVRVVDRAVCNTPRLTSLCISLSRLLAHCGSAPWPSWDQMRDRVHLLDGFVGPGYGHPTPQALHAQDVGRDAGLLLDATYTGKALAGLLAIRPRGTTLFWNSGPWC